MRILITGAAGRLGSTISDEFTAAGHDVAALRRTELDITDAEQVKAVTGRLQPDVIVNCSAYNAVDAAEAHAGAAYALNALGPSYLAAAARDTGALLVHFSTDFVFDGYARKPYAEDAPTNPLSVYGASKFGGEEAARRAPRHYVLRLESLFGGRPRRGHFATIDSIANTLLAGGVVRALVDRTVSPSYVPDVARATRRLLEREAPAGIYHCVNSGHTTWYDLARLVARTLHVPARIEPLNTAELATTAIRPQFCALSNEKLAAAGVDMPHWRNAIRRHLASRAVAIHSQERPRATTPTVFVR